MPKADGKSYGNWILICKVPTLNPKPYTLNPTSKNGFTVASPDADSIFGGLGMSQGWSYLRWPGGLGKFTPLKP